jgi:choline dehydrogenase
LSSFDVAIIGAGSAGCALASRLAIRTSLRIALIEAGPDYGPQGSGSWPRDLLDAHHTPESHDWDFEQSRARVIGGCSTHNECALVRPRPGDFDVWGVGGWRDADVQPLVDQIARAMPTTIPQDNELLPWQRGFLDAAFEAGFPRRATVDDAPNDGGVGPFIQNIARGERWNAAFAFLDPIRSRITIMAEALADRLVFERGRARALIVQGRDGVQEIRAERFVLCSGVYGTPAILLRSGVGTAKDLRKLDIPVHVDLSGVGANLHDHPGLALEYEPTQRLRRSTSDEAKRERFYQTQIVLRAAPDLHIIPYQTKGDDGWSFSILVFYLRPRSRGRMRLRSREAGAAPEIELGLLSDSGKHDLRALTDGLRLIHDLTTRAPLAELIASGPRRFRAAARLARYARNNVSDYGHSGGTCRLGDVVDETGRVRGMENVYAADASIMPIIPRANTNLACSAIGLRVGQLMEGV